MQASSADVVFGSAVRVVLLRALVLDARGGVLRAHAAADLAAATGLSLGRTRAALRVFVRADIAEVVRGPAQRRRIRLVESALLTEWLLPFFVAELRLVNDMVRPSIPGACLVRLATAEDVRAIKCLADRHRREMGFVLRATLETGQQREGLWIAHAMQETAPPSALGYVQVHHRLDGQITLHTIAVDTEKRTEGIGRALVAAVERDCRARNMRGILLRCPFDLPANQFYARIGFERLRTEPGKRRPLHVWWKECLESTTQLSS